MSSTTVRFSVVSFAPKGVTLAVVGGCPELGQWDVKNALTMRARLGQSRLLSEPDFHFIDVALPPGCKAEYKFIELTPNGSSGPTPKWEELGSNRNRQLELSGCDKVGDVILLPVERFAECGLGESDHTSKFYFGVKERNEISVRKVIKQIFIGSCPRTLGHIDYLKSLGVTVVVNFQTEADCKKNCVADIGMDEDPMAVASEYEKRGMEYIWLPTFDMSTDGRAQMLPQASFLLLNLIRRGHTIYSHCNAGVGRSVAAVCGYLVFGLGMPVRSMQHVIASSRPVAFFDFEALERARPHYEAMFGKQPGATGSDEACLREALGLL